MQGQTVKDNAFRMMKRQQFEQFVSMFQSFRQESTQFHLCNILDRRQRARGEHVLPLTSFLDVTSISGK